MTYTLPSDNIIEFIPAHYLHSPGNFSVYDKKSKILFSGDIGINLPFEHEGKIFIEDFEKHISFMEKFHKRYMASNKACEKWVAEVKKRDIEMIVPQHGAIFAKENVSKFLDWLSSLKCGVDFYE